MSEKLASLEELHEEVNSELILEDILHVYEEGVVDSVQDIFFELDIFHLLVLNYDVLADALHSVQLPRSGHLLHQEYLTEGAFSDHFQNFEVVQLCRAVLASSVKLLSAQHVGNFIDMLRAHDERPTFSRLKWSFNSNQHERLECSF